MNVQYLYTDFKPKYRKYRKEKCTYSSPPPPPASIVYECSLWCILEDLYEYKHRKKQKKEEDGRETLIWKS